MVILITVQSRRGVVVIGDPHMELAGPANLTYHGWKEVQEPITNNVCPGLSWCDCQSSGETPRTSREPFSSFFFSSGLFIGRTSESEFTYSYSTVPLTVAVQTRPSADQKYKYFGCENDEKSRRISALLKQDRGMWW